MIRTWQKRVHRVSWECLEVSVEGSGEEGDSLVTTGPVWAGRVEDERLNRRPGGGGGPGPVHQEQSAPGHELEQGPRGGSWLGRDEDQQGPRAREKWKAEAGEEAQRDKTPKPRQPWDTETALAPSATGATTGTRQKRGEPQRTLYQNHFGSSAESTLKWDKA